MPSTATLSPDLYEFPATHDDSQPVPDTTPTIVSEQAPERTHATVAKVPGLPGGLFPEQ